MPKKEYLSHPVTKVWRDDVRAELEKRGRGAQQRLLEHIIARGVKVSSGQLSDILNGENETSDIVEPVHEFLGWPIPLAPTASRDAGELVHVWQRLTKEQRALFSAGSGKVEEMSGDEARELLTKLIGAIKK